MTRPTCTKFFIVRKEFHYGRKIYCRVDAEPGEGGSIDPASALKTAHFLLGGSRLSDGFDALARAGHLELSLEALAVDKRFTQLFSDEEANNALSRLLEAGYRF